jgi:hypothetical protein
VGGVFFEVAEPRSAENGSYTHALLFLCTDSEEEKELEMVDQ